jgi:GntR family transcriptional regulator
MEDRLYETLDVSVVATEDFPDRIAGCFELSPGEAICRRYRVYATEGRRLMISTSYLPLALVAGSKIMEGNTGPGGTYARLADLGHAPVRFREEIKIRLPSDEEAKALKLTPSTPVALIARTAFDANDEPVEVNEMILDSTAYILEYDFSA